MTAIDVTEATFQEEVIERSRSVPVVVDFWAPWCGPCRALGPLLEDAATRNAGQVVLAKVNTDESQGLAEAFEIRGIPAVKAFRDGRVADEFVGVVPPAAVERFFARLIPSEADKLVGVGDEASLRRALELEPGRPDAARSLARLLLERGDRDEALAVLDEVRDGGFQLEGLRARLRLEGADGRDGSDGLADAFAALDRGAVEEGLDKLLEALEQADGERDDIRRVVVGELDVLGPASPLAREMRKRLAAALY